MNSSKTKRLSAIGRCLSPATHDIAKAYGLKQIESRITFSGEAITSHRGHQYLAIRKHFGDYFKFNWEHLLSGERNQASRIQAVLAAARILRNSYETYVAQQGGVRRSLLSVTEFKAHTDYELPSDFFFPIFSDARAFGNYRRTHGLKGWKDFDLWAVISLLLIDYAIVSLNRGRFDPMIALQLMDMTSSTRLINERKVAALINPHMKMVKKICDPGTLKRIGLRIHLQHAAGEKAKKNREFVRRGLMEFDRQYRPGKSSFDVARTVHQRLSLPMSVLTFYRHARAHLASRE